MWELGDADDHETSLVSSPYKAMVLPFDRRIREFSASIWAFGNTI